jgi:DNA-binding SARP family transcriptional activator
MPERASELVLPMLVPIGTRLGSQLLLNLGALGSVSIDAPAKEAQTFVRSVIDDLAPDELGSEVQVVWVPDARDTLEPPRRAELCSPTEVNEWFSGAIKSAASSPDHGTAGPARSGVRQPEARELRLVVMPAVEADPTVLRDVCPGLGVCVLLLGLHSASAATIIIEENGHGVLEPLGLQFDLLAPNRSTSQRSAGLINDETEEPSDVAADERNADSDNGHRVDSAHILSAESQSVVPEPQVLVRVLGAPEVVGFPQLGRIETSILAYLACHGGQRTADQIVNAVWNGRLVEPKTLWNKISKIRAVLGPEMVPPRQPNSAKVVIADSVMTDLGLLRLLVDRSSDVSAAEAVALLLRGLQLIDGVPFDSADYEWAFESQQHATGCELVEFAATQCVRLALELGDVYAARAAVACSLRALPTNEPLYRERMRVEATAGSPDGVRRALAELQAALSDQFDDVDQVKPAPVTLHLAAQLAGAR